MPRLRTPISIALLAATGAWGGCGDGAAPDGGQAGTGSPMQCLPDELPLDCGPAFQPTYEAFFNTHLRATCSAGGTSCHSADGAQAGLELDDRELAYDYLLGNVDGRARVVPGDPQCSPLSMRLESDDPEFVMPQGSQLPEGHRCAVRQWIANGAQR
jgi:hypothetical protein